MSGIIGRAGNRSGTQIIGAEGRIGQTCAASLTSAVGASSSQVNMTGYTQLVNTAPDMFSVGTNGISITHSAVYFVKISVYISVKTGNADGYVQNGLMYDATTRDDRCYSIFAANGTYGGHRQTTFASNIIDLLSTRVYGIWNAVQDGNRNINGSTDSMISGITLTYMNEV